MSATLLAVVRVPGPAWDPGRSLPEQDGWAAHAAFMNGLAVEGLVVLGGPLGDGGRFLLVLDAPSREAVERRLAADPWTAAGLLSVASVEPWEILLDRAAAAQPPVERS